MQQVADKMNFQDPVQKYAECHSWDMSNSNATKYHEIKVGILDNTCFKENVPTFEILVGWILRLGLNFWVINVALYGWKCDPAYHRVHPNPIILYKERKIMYLSSSPTSLTQEGRGPGTVMELLIFLSPCIVLASTCSSRR